MFDSFGFIDVECFGVLIMIDKFDKIGLEGVVVEFCEWSVFLVVVDVFEVFFCCLQMMEYYLFGECQICKVLLEGVLVEFVEYLVGIGEVVVVGCGQFDILLVFDLFFVCGMGYYMGMIFEFVYFFVGYLFGGGGCYDGMIGCFFGQQVFVVGFFFGFECFVDFVIEIVDVIVQVVVFIYDVDVFVVEFICYKVVFIVDGVCVWLEWCIKNFKVLLECFVVDGYIVFVIVIVGGDLEFKFFF